MADQGRSLQVCLDARIISGHSGGVEQAIISLAHGLSQLGDGPERYYFLTYANHQTWIRPYLGGPCRLLVDPVVVDASPPSPLKQKLLQKFPDIVRIRQRFRKRKQEISLPRSNGLIEKMGIDVMHFTKQSAFLTAVPSVYQPWDLLHLHYPQWLDEDAIAFRDTSYRAYCCQAVFIAVASPWVKDDLVENFQLPPEKVEVIPFAPPLDAYPQPTGNDLLAIREKYQLPEMFAFYPAQPYPHKNHLALLDALANLRDREGLSITLVCSGRLNNYYSSTIQKHVRQLGLQSQVSFLGFVSPKELACLYYLARLLIFPSKFEGWGLPVLEAFQAGLPVACSNVTTLPEIVGDAALLFDPQQEWEISASIRRLWLDDDLREKLKTRGRKRLEVFSPQKTAQMFRDIYRAAASGEA